jgi:hypothetical protein
VARPTATESASVRDIGVEAENAPLAPGTYTYSSFEPVVEFELGKGWRRGHLLPEFFDVQSGNGSLVIARPEWVTKPNGDPVDVSELSPRRALEIIATDPKMHAGDAVSATVDGRPAYSIVIDPTTDQHQILGGPEGSFTPSPGPRYRIMATRVGDVMVMVMPIALRTPYAEGFAGAEEILTTIHFVDG